MADLNYSWVTTNLLLPTFGIFALNWVSSRPHCDTNHDFYAILKHHLLILRLREIVTFIVWVVLLINYFADTLQAKFELSLWFL